MVDGNQPEGATETAGQEQVTLQKMRLYSNTNGQIDFETNENKSLEFCELQSYLLRVNPAHHKLDTNVSDPQ